MDSTNIFWNSTFPAYLEAISTFAAFIVASIAVWYAYQSYVRDRSKTEEELKQIEHQLYISGQLLQLEVTKRRNEIKPFFRSAGGGGGNKDVWSMQFKNLGERAHNVKLLGQNDFITFDFAEIIFVDKNEQISIVMRRQKPNELPIYDIPFKVILEYANEDGEILHQAIIDTKIQNQELIRY